MTRKVIVSKLRGNPTVKSRQAAQSLGVHPETFQNQTATANAQSDQPRRRRRYQRGTLVLKHRKPAPNGENRDEWYLKITERVGGKKTRPLKYLGPFQKYPTRDEANIAAEHLRLAANAEHPRPDISMRAFIDRYEAEILRPALVPVGANENPTARVAYRTAINSKSALKVWIRPRWERDDDGHDYKVSDFARPEMWDAIEKWFLHSVWRSDRNATGLAGDSARAIFSVMRHMFKYAVKWGYLNLNPLNEHRVELARGSSKRTTTPLQWTPAHLLLLLPHLCLMARAAVALAGWLGPRKNEIFGLKWRDIDFVNAAVNFVQGIVDGRITNLKTEASRTNLWLPPSVLEALREWRSESPFNRPEDWIFASAFHKGRLPLYPHSFLNTYIRPVALSLGLPRVTWLSFRHSVNAWAKNIDMPPDQRKILLRQASNEVNDKYGIVELEKKRDVQQRLVSYVEGYRDESRRMVKLPTRQRRCGVIVRNTKVVAKRRVP